MIFELIGEHHVAGSDLLLQAAHGGYGDQVGRAQFLQTPDVGLVRNFTGEKPMAWSMAGQKNDLPAAQPPGNLRRGRSPERRVERNFPRVLETIQAVKSASSNDGDLYHFVARKKFGTAIFPAEIPLCRGEPGRGGPCRGDRCWLLLALT